MKINLKSIVGIKQKSVDKKVIEHDKYVDFYYTNIINSIILHTFDTTKLEEAAPI
jgi:hypothetical protein